MSRKSLVPIQLPADPTQPLEAATKQYVDSVILGGGGDAALTTIKVIRASAVTVASATWTLMTFTAKEFGVDGWWDGSGTFTAPTTGLYRFTVYVRGSGLTAPNPVWLRAVHNGVAEGTTLQPQEGTNTAAAAGTTTFIFSKTAGQTTQFELLATGASPAWNGHITMERLVVGPPGPTGPAGPAGSGSDGFKFVQDAVPTATAVGQQWYKTDTGEAFVWYDGFWVEFAPGSSGSAPGAWAALSYVANWVDYSSGAFSVGRYRLVGDRVQLQGLVKYTGASPITPTTVVTIATLPGGFRPAVTTTVMASIRGIVGGYAFADVRVETNGNLAVVVAGVNHATNDWVALDNLSYPIS